MPKRAIIDTLPEPQRTEVRKALVESGFGNHVELAKRFGLSKSAVGRYAKQLRERRRKAELEAERGRARMLAALTVIGGHGAWLADWAARFPRKAERLVRVLKKREQKPENNNNAS